MLSFIPVISGLQLNENSFHISHDTFLYELVRLQPGPANDMKRQYGHTTIILIKLDEQDLLSSLNIAQDKHWDVSCLVAGV